MSHAPLISAEDAWAALRAGNALAVDCRHELADTERGARDYARAHVPGAVYAHLERDLSDLSLRGRGRHPLPSDEAFSQVLGRWGVSADTLVIAYDDATGAMAARLWWMLRLAGHTDVCVLEGGWAAWCANKLPVEHEVSPRAPTRYAVHLDRSRIASAQDVAMLLAARTGVVLDARAAPRFRGENETIDPVSGHVPGARNRPFTDNLAQDNRFKSPSQLRAEFAALADGHGATATVLMCGSGVTACHNLLALEHAGLSGARVYAGSWSEWISDPARPVVRGDQ
jgi:thiosulfate/3-mercaptopyruvate sulfurtransferase